MTSIPLVGYSDKISLRSQETISFKVSSSLKKPFKASLKRSISADPNPKGIGIIEEDASKYFDTTFVKSRIQDFDPGSYAVTKKLLKIKIKKEMNISIKIFPTLNVKRKQTILAYDNIELYIDAKGKLSFCLGKEVISIEEHLLLRSWYNVDVKISLKGKVTITQKLIKDKKKKN